MGQNFSLTKWYLDCVDEQGRTAIVYCARLGWHAAHMSYAGLLTNLSGTVKTASTLSGHSLHEEATRIDIDVPHLDLAGVWQTDTPAFTRTLLEREDGYVKWSCLQPRSKANLVLGGQTLCGLGYAERLELTLTPWRLPMRHLRWGRFVSPDEAVTWIDWKGAHQVRLLVRNGVEVPLENIDETRLTAPGLSLEFSDSLELRAGRLQNTVAPQVPALLRVFPAKILQVEESKWRSRGLLRTDGTAAQGWVIHEAVRWGKK